MKKSDPWNPIIFHDVPPNDTTSNPLPLNVSPPPEVLVADAKKSPSEKNRVPLPSDLDENGFWNPIIFNTPDQTNARPVITPSAEEAIVEPEFGTKPAFCDSALFEDFAQPDSLEAGPEPEHPVLPVSRPVPALVPPPALQPPVPEANRNPDTRDNTPKVPKAYDIAMELLEKLPIRLLGDLVYAFDGRIYRFVDVLTMNRLIMAHCRNYVQAVGDASIIGKIYDIILREPNLVFERPRKPVPFVAFEDGLLNLETFQFGTHSADPFVTVLLDANYGLGAISDCPAFDQFLVRITGGDTVLIHRIWQMIGYILAPDTSGKCFFLLQGVPDSGKSVLGDLITSLPNEALVTSLDIVELKEEFARSELVGKHLCHSLDMPSSPIDPNSASFFKKLTGGDEVTANVKYRSRVKFRNTATYLFATNHPFYTKEDESALFVRIVTIPFRYSIPRSEQNRNLPALLYQERNAIVYRALQAYRDLKYNNYQFDGDYPVNQVVADARFPTADTTLRDVLWAFTQRNCQPAEESFTPTSVIYDAFQKETGINWPSGINNFSTELAKILDQMFPGAVQKDRKRGEKQGDGKRAHERGFRGIKLRLLE